MTRFGLPAEGSKEPHHILQLLALHSHPLDEEVLALAVEVQADLEELLEDVLRGCGGGAVTRRAGITICFDASVSNAKAE